MLLRAAQSLGLPVPVAAGPPRFALGVPLANASGGVLQEIVLPNVRLPAAAAAAGGTLAVVGLARILRVHGGQHKPTSR